MKLILAVLLVSSALLAQQPAPVPFGVTMQQGTTTLYCSLIDLRQFGGIFALSKPSIMCVMQTTNPTTTEFAVTITTRDTDGNVHTYSDHTAVGLRGSPLWFATDDTVLMSVTVQEKALLAETKFEGAQ